MTTRELYRIAKERKLLDAPIRISDGMAVSFYPEPECITPGRYEVVLDVSACEPIDYDQLDEHARHWQHVDNRAADELDAYAQACYDRERGEQNHRFRRDLEAERRREYLRARQAKINTQGDPDSVPWEIYGYYPDRRHPRRPDQFDRPLSPT